MQALRRRGGFTLIELLVVILILAILLAIGLPLYLRAVREGELKTCRTNMQTIATALQAYRIANSEHQYTDDMTKLIGASADLQGYLQCPTDADTTTPDIDTDDYDIDVWTDAATGNPTGFVISCTEHGDTHGWYSPNKGFGVAPVPTGP